MFETCNTLDAIGLGLLALLMLPVILIVWLLLIEGAVDTWRHRDWMRPGGGRR